MSDKLTKDEFVKQKLEEGCYTKKEAEDLYEEYSDLYNDERLERD